MALSDESNYGFVKQVALEWRESVREKRNMEMMSPTPSMLDHEQSWQRFGTQGRRTASISRERRSSNFYRQSFSKETKAVEIERREGSMKSDRIRVNDEVDLHLHQPVPITNEIRASLKNAGTVVSDTSLLSDGIKSR